MNQQMPFLNQQTGFLNQHSDPAGIEPTKKYPLLVQNGYLLVQENENNPLKTTIFTV
ncbi:TPA: hypothetical protein NQM91_002974 [Salmonella enterica]|nr:hypothetical protein [Salmonella enterica]